MKYFKLIPLIPLGLSLAFSANAAQPWDKDGYTLVTHDEFDTAVLQPIWFPYYLPHWSSRELTQTNYEIMDGVLRLKIDPETPPWDVEHDQQTVISGIQTGNKNWLHRWTDGYTDISSNEPVIENFLQKYGYFEIRAKTQKGSGIHSAWWMIGFQEDGATWDDTTQTSEIDIFEILGRETDRALFNNHTWTDPDVSYATYNINLGFDSSEQFHVYGFEWEEDHMSLYVDGQLKATINHSIHYPMVTLLGLYEKRHGGWTGQFDPSIPYPKTFEIDYFRAYHKNNMLHRNNEAEHAKYNGTVFSEIQNNASNGRVAKYVGNGADNYIEYKYIWASYDGEYHFDLSYISGVNRNIYVKVNDSSPIKLSELNSGSWTDVGHKTFTALLRKGNNTIRLYNPDDYAPDIDKLTISEN